MPNRVAASDAVSAIRRWLDSQGWPCQPPDGHVVAAYNVFASRGQQFWNQLKHAGVEQLAAGPKAEAADRELEQRMRRELRLLPPGEANTCFVLISGDMDFLHAVRDELRGNVSVIWVHTATARLAESTLRQIEEATRPSACPGPRATSELISWEALLSSHLASSNGAPGSADEAAAGADATPQGTPSRSRSRSRSRGGASRSRSHGASSSPPPINSVPLGASASSGAAPPHPDMLPAGPPPLSPARALPPLRSTASFSPGSPSLPPPPSGERCRGRVQHWNGQPANLWGYAVRDGDEQTRHHFRHADIIGAAPAQVRVGMPVEFRPSANPPRGKHGGKPTAIEVVFLSPPP